MSFFTQLTELGEAATRHTVNVANAIAQMPGALGGQEPISDPRESAGVAGNPLGHSCMLESGVVLEAIPYTNSYKVAPQTGGAVFQCCFMAQLPTTPIGVTDNTTLQPGVNVYYLRHPKTSFGVIIGVEPTAMDDPRAGRSDFITQGSRVGFLADKFFKSLFGLGGSGTNAGIIDWSSRQPVDSLPVGEWCKTAETGLQFFMDSYMMHMRVDEMTGVFAYYWDQLLRITGQNYQRWTGNSVFESLDDEGEHFWRQGIAIYPWEQLGSLTGPQPSLLKERTPEQTQHDAVEYARYEPDPDDLQSFHRVQVFEGYLGQGGKRLLVTKPAGVSCLRFEPDASMHPEIPGLVEEVRTLGGHVGMRTVTGFTFGKRPAIPTPKRLRLPADEAGDNPNNYRSSGHYGSSVPHKLQHDPDLPSGSWHAGFVHTCGVQDMHANIFNWEANHPFAYHDKDYDYPEESELTAIDTNQWIPTWQDLEKGGPIRVPPTVEIDIDHRSGYEKLTVYKSSAYWTVTDDGSMEFGDGYGAGMRFSGGNLYLQVPGDIMLEAGRTAAIWGGRDVAIRAWQSVDITANKNDVRIKGENGIYILAANSKGPYGVMIESRAANPGYDFSADGQAVKCAGILLHAPSSELVSLTRSAYIRTGPCANKSSQAAGDSTPVRDGDIVFDASEGGAHVDFYANCVRTFVACAVTHAFGKKGDVKKVTHFTKDNSVLAGDTYIDDKLVVNGSVLVDGGVYASDKCYDGAATATAQANAGQAFMQSLVTWAKGKFTEEIAQNWYKFGRPGNRRTQEGMWASYRVDADYAASEFELFESRWAQIARLSSTIPKRWEENAVMSGHNQAEYPFPGRKRMMTEEAYRTQDTSLYDTKKGISEDRGARFEEPAYATPQKQQLNCNYPISKKA